MVVVTRRQKIFSLTLYQKIGNMLKSYDILKKKILSL
jgi:hypothetical protein